MNMSTGYLSYFGMLVEDKVPFFTSVFFLELSFLEKSGNVSFLGRDLDTAIIRELRLFS